MAVTILVIGSNSMGRLGLSADCRTTETLINFTKYHRDKCITNAYYGYKYAIYTDDNHENIWCAGITKWKMNKIDFFNKENIKIKKIFANCYSNRIFWVTNKGLIYEDGIDEEAPKHVAFLQNVIDIQSSDKFSFALCITDKNIAGIILESWTKILFIDIPNDIISLIIVFYHRNTVYTNKQFLNNEERKWKEIDALKDANIIKMSSGIQHTLFLDANGNVFCDGRNNYYQLGASTKDIWKTDEPILNTWFIDNNIKIKDISCGGHHCLAIDTNYKVYGWGYNEEGQCGIGTDKNVSTPTLIPNLENYKIEHIDCGVWHSYCGTFNGKHFLFGENDFSQCIVNDDDDDGEYVLQPGYINDIIHKIAANKTIKSVILGNDTTAILMEDN